jgi:TetR/AcrR family transcriptional regulator, acrAB operon repressor
MYVKSMKRAAEDAERTKRDLLDAAMAVFLEKSYGETRVEDIADRAGVTRGAFYHHFGSKREAYLALVDERYAPARELFARLLGARLAPVDFIEGLVAGYLGLIARDESLRQVHELITLKTSFVEELSDSIQEKRRMNLETIGSLESEIGKAQRDGMLRLAMEPRQAAIFVFSALSGIIVDWLMDRKSFDLSGSAVAYAKAIIRAIEV